MRIKKLKIRAFRGFIQEKEFEFAPITILFGANGTGKSSTLNAIEWCMWGKECTTIDNTGIRERIDWELENRKAQDPPFVEIELKDNEKLLRKGISKSKDEFNCEENIQKLLKQYSFRDFKSGVYQHQEAIHDILVEEPRKRNEGFDRLLGLSAYRNILEAIKIGIGEIKKINEDWEKDFSSFEKNIKQKIEILRQEIRKNKEEAIKKGIKEEDINSQGEIKYKKEVLKEIKEIFEEALYTPTEEFNILRPEENTERFIEKIKEEIKKCRENMPDIKYYKELNDQLRPLQSLLSDYQNAKISLNNKKEEFKKFVTSHGDKQQLEENKKKIEEKIKEKEREKEQKNLKGAIIQKAVDYLSEEGIEKNICPVCGKETKDLLAHLKEEYEKKYRLIFKELDEEIKSLKDKLKETKNLIENLTQLEEQKNRAELNYKRSIEEIKKYLKREIKDDEDPEAIIKKEMEPIQKEMENLQNNFEKKQKKLNRIEDKIFNIEKINEILKKYNNIEKNQEASNTEEWKKMKEKIEESKKIKEKLENIIIAINKASQEEATTIINSVEEKINNYFRKIAQHPAIEKIIFEVSQDSKTGSNKYEIKDNEGNSVIPILSQGHLNALALSIFLALSENMPFEFIMLDDPSQSLGSEEKRRFVDVLEEVSQNKQIIISTMDKEFFDHLSKMTKRKIIYKFEAWNPSDGPQIQRE